jgi:hypothetical protein
MGGMTSCWGASLMLTISSFSCLASTFISFCFGYFTALTFFGFYSFSSFTFLALFFLESVFLSFLLFYTFYYFFTYFFSSSSSFFSSFSLTYGIGAAKVALPDRMDATSVCLAETGTTEIITN